MQLCAKPGAVHSRAVLGCTSTSLLGLYDLSCPASDRWDLSPDAKLYLHDPLYTWLGPSSCATVLVVSMY